MLRKLITAFALVDCLHSVEVVLREEFVDVVPTLTLLACDYGFIQIALSAIINHVTALPHHLYLSWLNQARTDDGLHGFAIAVLHVQHFLMCFINYHVHSFNIVTFVANDPLRTQSFIWTIIVFSMSRKHGVPANLLAKLVVILLRRVLAFAAPRDDFVAGFASVVVLNIDDVWTLAVWPSIFHLLPWCRALSALSFRIKRCNILLTFGAFALATLGAEFKSS